MVRTKTPEDRRKWYLILFVLTLLLFAVALAVIVIKILVHHRRDPSYTVADAVLRNFNVNDDNLVTAATTVSFNLTVHNPYKDKSMSFTNVSASFSFLYPELVDYLPGKPIATASSGAAGEAPITVPSGSNAYPIPFQLRAIDGVTVENAGSVKKDIATSNATAAYIQVDAQVRVQNSAASRALHLKCELTISVNDYVDNSSTNFPCTY